jgi:hypothetical protein
MVDSLGYVVVPTDVFAGNSIDPDRAAWTFERTIGPREALYPKISVGTDNSFVSRVQVGMIASRRIEV